MGEIEQLCVLLQQKAFGERSSEEYSSSRRRTMFRRDEVEEEEDGAAVSQLIRAPRQKSLETLERRGLFIVLQLESDSTALSLCSFSHTHQRLINSRLLFSPSGI